MKCLRIRGRSAGIGLATLLAMFSPAVAHAQGQGNPLLDPVSEAMRQQAPEVFTARFETSKGDIVIEVHRAWAPQGADRFYSLVKKGYYNDCRFFRVIATFMAQVGIHGDPTVTKAWLSANILDDPVKRSNTRGYVTYAQSAAPNSRTTQFFINYKDNSYLDDQRFAPFGQVVQGMEVVDALYSGYGEGPPRGSGPDQMQVMRQGNAYLAQSFPKLDYVKTCSILGEGPFEAEKK